jgi:hypothetical protein
MEYNLMEWYEWDSLESFEQWHNEIKSELGLPAPSENQSSGEIDENAQWTINYTEVVQVENKWIARVENRHSDGLTSTNLTPVYHEWGSDEVFVA